MFQSLCLAQLECCRLRFGLSATSELRYPGDDAVLWRYMDFAKFVDLLVSRTLWFSRVDRLGDSREGLLTESEFTRLSKRSPATAS